MKKILMIWMKLYLSLQRWVLYMSQYICMFYLFNFRIVVFFAWICPNILYPMATKSILVKYPTKSKWEHTWEYSFRRLYIFFALEIHMYFIPLCSLFLSLDSQSIPVLVPCTQRTACAGYFNAPNRTILHHDGRKWATNTCRMSKPRTNLCSFI